jgi:hypothetical protein
MAKKPLTLVRPSADPALTPPQGLGESGSTLWTSIQGEYGIVDAGGRETLFQICAAVDRAEDCRQRIASDGPMVTSQNGAMRDHPLLKIELSNRAFAVRALARLNLDTEPLKVPGRPLGGLRGYRGV